MCRLIQTLHLCWD